MSKLTAENLSRHISNVEFAQPAPRLPQVTRQQHDRDEVGSFATEDQRQDDETASVMPENSPVVWMPDSSSSNCLICKLMFVWHRRRHHCRACGRLVCDNCSPARASLVWLGLEPGFHRVCVECVRSRSEVSENVVVGGLIGGGDIPSVVSPFDSSPTLDAVPQPPRPAPPTAPNCDPFATVRLLITSSPSLDDDRRELYNHVLPKLRQLCEAALLSFQPIDLRLPPDTHGPQVEGLKAVERAMAEVSRCTTPRTTTLALHMIGGAFGFVPQKGRDVTPHMEHKHKWVYGASLDAMLVLRMSLAAASPHSVYFVREVPVSCPLSFPKRTAKLIRLVRQCGRSDSVLEGNVSGLLPALWTSIVNAFAPRPVSYMGWNMQHTHHTSVVANQPAPTHMTHAIVTEMLAMVRNATNKTTITALVGLPGSGCSTILAFLVRSMIQNNRQPIDPQHQASLTTSKSDGAGGLWICASFPRAGMCLGSILERLSNSLADGSMSAMLPLPHAPPSPTLNRPSVSTLDAAVNKFVSTLTWCSARAVARNGCVVCVIDAVHVLCDGTFAWLPDALLALPNVHIVVSCSEQYIERLKRERSTANFNIIQMPALSPSARTVMFNHMLLSRDITIPGSSLVPALARVEGVTPLFLGVVAAELQRAWPGSSDKCFEVIAALPPSATLALENILSQRNVEVGEDLVRHAVCVLECARDDGGLTEFELLAALQHVTKSSIPATRFLAVVQALDGMVSKGAVLGEVVVSLSDGPVVDVVRARWLSGLILRENRSAVCDRLLVVSEDWASKDGVYHHSLARLFEACTASPHHPALDHLPELWGPEGVWHSRDDMKDHVMRPIRCMSSRPLIPLVRNWVLAGNIERALAIMREPEFIENIVDRGLYMEMLQMIEQLPCIDVVTRFELRNALAAIKDNLFLMHHKPDFAVEPLAGLTAAFDPPPPQPRGHTARISACAFFTRSSNFFTSSFDSTIKVWDFGSQRVIKTFDSGAHDGPVLSLGVGQLAQRIVSVTPSTIKVWGVSQREPMARRLEEAADTFTACAFAADEILAAVGTASGVVKMLGVQFDVCASLTDRHQMQAHTSAVSSLCFGDSSLLTTCDRGWLKVWDVARGELRVQHQPSSDALQCSLLLPWAPLALAGSDSGKLFLWDTRSASKVTKIAAHRQDVTGLDINPLRHHVISGSLDGSIKVWDARTWKVLHVVGAQDGVLCCSLAHTDTESVRIVCATFDTPSYHSFDL
eukprot:c10081_g1_i1.p1 GENE.c10081_g1_i1~~c10081_g1_i1.p1  ORF type:complete len:1239 (+),score=348.75 c10081_g1_i1:3275-6991(+)